MLTEYYVPEWLFHAVVGANNKWDQSQCEPSLSPYALIDESLVDNRYVGMGREDASHRAEVQKLFG
jgi:hypothetical protein